MVYLIAEVRFREMRSALAGLFTPDPDVAILLIRLATTHHGGDPNVSTFAFEFLGCLVGN